MVFFQNSVPRTFMCLCNTGDLAKMQILMGEGKRALTKAHESAFLKSSLAILMGLFHRPRFESFLLFDLGSGEVLSCRGPSSFPTDTETDGGK